MFYAYMLYIIITNAYATLHIQYASSNNATMSTELSQNEGIVHPVLALHDDMAAGSSDRHTHLVSPEAIRPYPKSTTRKVSKGRVAKKCAILTDTPERGRAALAAEGKKNKSSHVKRALILENAEAEVESEPGEVVEHDERENPEEPIKFQDKDPEPGDYVLVEYEGKSKKRHYIGLIT